VTYELDNYFGHVGVIDPTKDQLIKRIQLEANSGPMAMDPAEAKLYVVNTLSDTVSVLDANTFDILASIFVGSSFTNSSPVAVFVAPYGDKAYVANYNDRAVTIINTLTNKIIKRLDMGPGKPFAFASNKNSAYVYVACKVEDGEDYVVAIAIKDDAGYMFGNDLELAFDEPHNPLTVHPDGHTLVVMGTNGFLCYFDADVKGQPASFSFLDNTVSGVYLDNRKLFCASEVGKNYMKRITNLTVTPTGQIGYQDFRDINSFKGQDKIRASRSQKYIGITIQPTNLPRGGLQVYNQTTAQSQLVSLSYVGDLAFFSDTKAYVGELQGIRPIDLNTATALPPIELGSYETVPVQVKNIISGYRNES